MAVILPPHLVDFREGRAGLPGHMDSYMGIGITEEFEEVGFYFNDRTGCYYSHCHGVVWPVKKTVDDDNPFEI